MSTTSTHDQVMQARDVMRKFLRDAMAERDQRPDLVSDGPRTVPAWVLYEREVMTSAVNFARLNRGLEPVTLKDVARVEQQACGHVDYFQKYALYCAELAIDIKNPKP